jgi:hypothetical protein
VEAPRAWPKVTVEDMLGLGDKFMRRHTFCTLFAGFDFEEVLPDGNSILFFCE